MPTVDEAPQPKPSKPKSNAAKQTPGQWCAALGKYNVERNMTAKKVKRPVWQHASADALHGWAQHAHDAGEPIKLTEQDYLKALVAVESNPLRPHKPAVSQYCKHDFKD